MCGLISLVFCVLRFGFWLLPPIVPLSNKNYRHLIKTNIQLDDGSIIAAETLCTLNTPLTSNKPIRAATPSNEWVYGRSPAETAGSNPAGGIHVLQLWVLCFVRVRPLRRADHSSVGVLPNLLRRCVWSRYLEKDRTRWAAAPQEKNKYMHVCRI
jgi:hypothetical protein